MQIIIFYDIAIFLAFLYARFKQKRYVGVGVVNYNEIDKILFWIFSFVFFIITSCRHYAFGGPDTENYCYYFKGDMTSYYYAFDEIKDIGYIFINDFFRIFSRDYNFFIFWSSCISFLPILYGIYKYSGDRLLSLTIFAISMPDVWILGMCALRQYFAIAFGLCAIFAYLSKYKYRNTVAIVFLIIACLCHSFFFMIGPVLVLMRFVKLSKRTLYICLFIAWLTIFISDIYSDIMDYFSLLIGGTGDSFSKYADRYGKISVLVNKNPWNMLPLNFLPACLLFFINDKDRNRALLQVYVLGFCLYDMLCKTQIGIRMTTVFIIIGAIFLPQINMNDSKYKTYYQYVTLIVLYISWRTILCLEHYDELNEIYWNYSFFKF